MLDIKDLSFHYGGHIIYDEASLHIKPKTRTGLIGANGTGKTTLLKLIYGQLTPDGGLIGKSNDCSLGFLNQDLLSFESDEPILDVAMQAFERELHLQHQIEEALKQMETDYSQEALDRLARLQDEFETLDGYAIQAKAEEILEGLGFTSENLKEPLKKFSGGWRMRVMLGKLLLQKPSLLMLDEPTNHLDLPSIQWLENYLSSYEGAVLIVSHDREFLDRACNQIVEVTGGKLVLYAGNYSFYEEEKELRLEIQKNAFKNQQQKIKQTERFIERFRSKATKARQVQSRVNMLDKMDRVEEVREELAEMNFKFRFQQQPGKTIVQLKEAHKSYGNVHVIDNTDITLNRGDKVAMVGANGKGKSTLLRMIAGSERFQGVREPGYNVIQTFYAQHQLEALNIENEILQELKEAGSSKTEQELRALLGCFLFTDEDVFKKIKVLSGGEKSRVALAKTLISEANFLLLDEPTNHLDMMSVNILVEALQQYSGTFLVVSHDRHFVSRIATKIWYIEDMQVKEYPGTFEEFQRWMDKRAVQASVSLKEKEGFKQKQKGKQVYKQQQQRTNVDSKQIKRLKTRVAELEQTVAELEQKKQESEEEMAKPSVYSDAFKLAELTETYESIKAKLEEANEEWFNLSDKLEELEK